MNTLERLNYQAADFEVIQEVMHRYAGINLHDGKKELVYSRLAKRVRGLGFDNFRDYCRILGSNDDEILHCINSMTTNVTSFFRENHHFEFLKEQLLEKPHSGKAGTRRLRIWSAGCSTGEEPYSIAFTCAAYPQIETEIVATDLDSDVLARASAGIYKYKDVAAIEHHGLKQWFLRGKGNRSGQVRVKDRYRQMVQFSQLNLKHDWQHDEPFDVIFCRNVMIYFDNDLRSQLIQKFHDHLRPGGCLILGHSESLFGLSNQFSVVGKTTHQRRI